MLNEETFNNFTRNGMPTHVLHFNINDVCLVLRAIPSLRLATNTRVQIVRVLPNSIRVQTLNAATARFVKNLPRITFKFRLEYSESFQMTRMHWHVTSEPTIFYSYYTVPVYYYGVDRCGHHLSVHGNS